MIKYVLLARHGEVDYQPGEPDREQALKCGAEDVKRVASALAEFITVQPENERIAITELWHGDYRQVRQSAGCYREILEKSGVRMDEIYKRDLDPDRFWSHGTLKNRKAFAEELLKRLAELDGSSAGLGSFELHGAAKPEGNAILVVGHQPQLSWTAETVLAWAVPVSRAELICIAIDDSPWQYRVFSQPIADLFRRRWLKWAISPSDEALTVELRGKIESKMRLAGLWGPFITAMLSLLLGALLQKDKLAATDAVSRGAVEIGAACLFMGLALYLATLYAYDRLLMPIRFWADSAKKKDQRWVVKRPPSSANWILYQNMIRVWNWMFTPANLFVIAGLASLSFAALEPVVVTVLWSGLIVLISYYRHFRPSLGSED